jgi:hypothetical protein
MTPEQRLVACCYAGLAWGISTALLDVSPWIFYAGILPVYVLASKLLDWVKL